MMRSKLRFLKGSALVAGLLLLSLVLTACQVYEGYPVATPEPTVATTTVAPTAVPVPTLPPPPTVTPRPTLPATPANVQLQKTDILKDGFNRIMTYYFYPLNSADIYEVGLRSIKEGLMAAGVSQPDVPIPNFGTQANDNWLLFSQAYTLVATKYKDQVSEDDLQQFAFEGTLASLKDCESQYVPIAQSDAYANLRLSLQQPLVGIGVNFLSATATNGQTGFIISRIIKGGPAELAGLKLGDQFVAIDGQSLADKDQNGVADLLRGHTATESEDKALGTKISLTVRRASESQDRTFNLTRTQVQIPFMEHQVINKVGYLRFNRFPVIANQTDLDTVNKTLSGWLDEFKQANVSGIVIDLRDNVYGSVRLMQNFLSYFLTGNDLIDLQGSQANQSGGRDPGVIPMASIQEITKIDTPMAVLINGNTRSEAELFAYAIQHNKRGTIVGDTSYGCAAASSPAALNDNSVINLMIYRAVQSPNAPTKPVAAIEPETKVTLDINQLIQGQDTQLDAAVKAVTK